jgi:NhaP-type Na+/H+ or K+/H+ antiporter
MAKKSEATERAVVVCTARRGVFFGYATDTSGDTITLLRARMCVKWVGTRGVVGLAATGPTNKCRITAAAPSIEICQVTAVFDCTDRFGS